MRSNEFKGHPLLSIWRLRFQTWENESGDKRSKLTVLLETFQFLPRSGAVPVDRAEVRSRRMEIWILFKTANTSPH